MKAYGSLDPQIQQLLLPYCKKNSTGKESKEKLTSTLRISLFNQLNENPLPLESKELWTTVDKTFSQVKTRPFRICNQNLCSGCLNLLFQWREMPVQMKY
jgi:hypothetical protein